ncbi:hypothetical protein QYE76_067634 [Lolium multiflorum]|uniref:Uncharacterized protein n=1 Tax=Lolium multiflorum TaxID=4521 RepID=A0AAD8SD67_LOLMU|nr:hypothetical protein QYE76_067634 [Lolium multiflorum]
MIVSLLTGTGLFNISDFVPALSWMDLQGVQAKLRRVHTQFDGLITKLLAEHAATAEDRAREGRLDFVDKLRASKDDEDGETISEINIKGLIFDMFTAGTDTSSIIVEWAMAEMMKNPSIMARAQEEMDRVVGRDRRLEESDIAGLPYLQAICKEAMRLHPSTPLSLPHFSFEECEVDGYRVPASTRLLVNIWAIGRHPDAWEDPLEFRPERFLSGPAAKVDPMGNYFERSRSAPGGGSAPASSRAWCSCSTSSARWCTRSSGGCRTARTRWTWPRPSGWRCPRPCPSGPSSRRVSCRPPTLERCARMDIDVTVSWSLGSIISVVSPCLLLHVVSYLACLRLCQPRALLPMLLCECAIRAQ